MPRLSGLSERFEQAMQAAHHPQGSEFVVAYSGGLDSSALLTLAVDWAQRNEKKISAIHINHQLQSASSSWATHCKDMCGSLNIPLKIIEVSVQKTDTGIEAAARQARHQAFEANLPNGAVLLLAHHQQDQAETFLFRLFRGAGVNGLAAMRPSRPLGAGYLFRPLLDVTRTELEEFAEQSGLKWIDDPSNADVQLSRNYLRHQVLPVIRTHWPGVDRVIARAADAMQAQQTLLDELAEQDWRDSSKNDRLQIDGLLTLSFERQCNLMRFYLARLGEIAPDRAVLQTKLAELIGADGDRMPEWHLARHTIYRFDGELYGIAKSLSLWQSPVTLEVGREQVVEYLGKVVWRKTLIGLDEKRVSGAAIELRRRAGGEKIKLAGDTHTRELKKLLQQWRIPPWERERVPLLYVDGELAAVVGYGVAQSFAVQDGWEVTLGRRGF